MGGTRSCASWVAEAWRPSISQGSQARTRGRGQSAPPRPRHGARPGALPSRDPASPRGSVIRTFSPSTIRARRRMHLLYYVMPFVKGESMRARLEREQQLSIDDAVQIAYRSRDGARLRAPAGHRPSRHQAGEHPAEDGHALVADFGIARAISAMAARRSSRRPASRSARRRT